VDTAFGAGTARVDDAGRITLTPRGAALQFLAAVDTLEVVTSPRARIVLSAREGTVVAGGSVEVGPAVISHHGITLEIGGSATAGTATGLVHVPARASVLDVAAGLHAAGARPEEIAAIFESLRAAGAIQAEVVVR
jgi:flagellar P-ring protein precursor FlgI